MTGEECRAEDLGGGVFCRVSKAHTFGTDALLLAHFAAPKARETACDLGTGCGIIPLLWLRETPGPKAVFALELQGEAVALARQSAALSGLEDRLQIHQGDLAHLPGELPRGHFDLVTCNPPYKAVGAGVLSGEESARLARHETGCTLEDVFAAGAKLLRFGGRFCLCQLPERLPDVLEGLRRHRLEPKRLRFVQERGDTPPWLLLCEAKLGAKPFLQVEKPLLLRENGADSRELNDMMRGYRKQGGA